MNVADIIVRSWWARREAEVSARRTLYFHCGGPLLDDDLPAALCLTLTSDEAEAMAIRLLRASRKGRLANEALSEEDREVSAVISVTFRGAGVSKRVRSR